MNRKIVVVVLAAATSAVALFENGFPFTGSGVICDSATNNESCTIAKAQSGGGHQIVDQSVSEEIKLYTERGAGIDIDYIPAGRLVVQINGSEETAFNPNEFNPFDVLDVITTKRLEGDGARVLLRNPTTGALSLSTAETALSDYNKKDTVVLLNDQARAQTVNINASSGLANKNAGDVVVVANNINALNIKANGYDGKNGESPLVGAAKKIVAPDYAGFATSIPSGVGNLFKNSRTADSTKPLSLTQQDLDAYNASGLACRADETAIVGSDPSNSYAVSQAGASGASIPEGIELLAFGKEEAKRTLCRRPAEMSAVQSCAAEREYSWQLACSIVPEQRSFVTLKREPIKWQRLLCGASTTSQIRRKIVRQANISINIPGVKSYNGIITRTISFSDSAQVYIPNNKSVFYPDQAGKKWIESCSKPGYETQVECEGASGVWSSTNAALSWYNPFWKQDRGGSSQIELAANLTVANTSTNSSYPAADTSNAVHNTGAALTLVPREASETDPTLLFPTNLPSKTYTNTYNTNPNMRYTVSQSCANIIDTTRYASFYGLDGVYSNPLTNTSKNSSMGSPGATRGGPALNDIVSKPWANNPDRYPTLEYLLAFDSSALGITEAEMVAATGPNGTGVIQITNCSSYEVMDGVITADVVRGEWALISGGPEIADLNGLTPPSIPRCSESSPTPVGSETFTQFEDDGVCYAANPSDPPNWLKEKVRNDLGLPQNLNISGSNIPIDALSSKAYVAADVFPGAGFPAGAAPTTAELHKEFIWPSDMTEAQISGLPPTDRDGFCVEPLAGIVTLDGVPATSILSAQTSKLKLTRSRLIQKYDIPANSSAGVAIPTGAVKKTCDAGIRLDVFLSQVTRPTCREGTSTKQKIIWWSDASHAPKWAKWSQKTDVLNTLIDPKYSIKSENIDTRYDDLPSTVLTSYTHDVDPSEFIPAGSSATGKAFPPTYGFSTEDGSRKLSGWTREGSLINGATALSFDSFYPYAGPTNDSRKAQWCNAPAYTTKDGRFVKSFGARGILRDPAKHIYGFDLTTHSVGGDVTQKYVGIEITGTNEQYGFYVTEDAFPSAVPTKFSATADVLAQNTSSLANLFKKKSYPNIGGRFAEVCGVGERYNQFTGFCHAGTESDTEGSWRASRRTVERYDQTGEKTPWAIAWRITDAFLSSINKLNSPFGALATNISGLSISDANSNHIARLGVLRPTADMANNEYGIDTSILINRPETVSIPVRGPYFAEPVAATANGVCARRSRILAVPVSPTATASIEMPSVGEFLPDGTIMMAVDFDCASPPYTEGTAITMRGAIVKLASSTPGATLSNMGISSGQNFTKLSRDNTGAVFVRFLDASGSPKVTLSNIKESMASGVSSTTGFETLTPSALKIKQRDRAGEWSTSGRTRAGKGWQSSIKTQPTIPVSDGTITALSCAPGNLRSGVWGEQSGAPAGSPPIYNASSMNPDGITVTYQCSSDAECALTEEELTLFTRPVPDSLTPITTRPAVEQYTPWSFELPSSAPRTSDSSQAPFGAWTKVTPDGAGAPTPSCDIFANASSTDESLTRTSLESIPSSLVVENIEAGTVDIKKPGTTNSLLMSIKLDQDLRKSDSCIEWDKVTGQSCLSFAPSVGRTDLAPYVFGGSWTRVTVETSPRRVSQDCGLFQKDGLGQSTEKCDAGVRPLVASTNMCDPTKATSALCQPCPGGDPNQKLCAPWMLPKEPPKVSLCKPGLGGCEYPTQSTLQQVETSVPMPGQPGENGTDGGSVTVFCGQCGNINVENRGGLGGQGSTTVSSSVSKNLTCASWNRNPLDPRFYYRVLWSKPFDSAGNGQNGVRGLDGGSQNIYNDLTPEAIYMISQPEFWLNGAGGN